nr:hypothetical protein [Pedobacter sp. ASV2]
MIKTILWTILLICILITVLWFQNESVKTFINEIGSLVTVLSSIIALSVFLQFYNEFKKARLENEEKLKLERATLNSKMVSLGTEILNNIMICNLFIGDKPAHLAGTEAPNITFEYSVMSTLLNNGDILHHKLRAELTGIIFEMKALNRIVETQSQIMVYKSLVDVSRLSDIKTTMINSLSIFHSKVPSLRTRLADCQPFFEALWNKPEDFQDEKYLKEQLITEGVIR